MPYKYGVNGKVVATKPLSYQGKLIDDFWMTFEKGKVVEYGAGQEEEALKNLVEYLLFACMQSGKQRHTWQRLKSSHHLVSQV